MSAATLDNTTTTTAARRTSRYLWLALAATVGGAILGGLYFTIGGIFGPLSDVAGGLMGVTVAIAAVALRQLMQFRGIAAAGFTLLVGVIAGTVLVLSSVGTIISSAAGSSFGWTFLVIQFLGTAGIGAWVLSASIAARQLLRRRTVVTGVIAGACYLLMGVVEPLTGITQTLTFTAGPLGILAFIVWVVFATTDLRRIRGNL